MNISITGATGCLGQPLLDILQLSGYQVKALLLPQDRLPVRFINKFQVINGDINSTDTLESFCHNSDIIFHLAGKVHYVPKSKFDELDFFRINVDGTQKLISSAKKNKVKRIVFFSTVGVYGKNFNFHGNEDSACRPITSYAKSKLLAENLILKSSKNGGPEGVVLRFPVVYGPLDRGNVAKMIETVHKKIFFYFGDGNYKRSMISSKNAAEAAIKAAFEPKAANETFLVTDGQDYTLTEFANAICEALDTNWRPFHIPLAFARLAGIIGDGIERIVPFSFPLNSNRVSKLSGSLTFSCEKAKKKINYQPIESLREGIKREVEWLKLEKRWK
ncbi:NAD dependent epimerase/dehydratase [Desulfosarcina ovata subsp. sediminis]|uniref:NAD dependent epimerase/dehydratase n=1 Tax=Desulfosarcina ovata subsp. sediminis TaxID=885957 RepID=A0A5K7ZDJ1_9BACT|nr:NAD-dependent epimerase/dehydratase family protein [Desulfosarcina ovata]BBO80258.1 NAD dependent epimerase/dehydratase [Desulfosarcina ovata subsp. sediminis]